MKKVFKVLGVIAAVLFAVALMIYLFVLQYPNLKENPKVGKWYRVSGRGMKDSEGGSYHALFKK